MMSLGESERLPSGYQEVEYIESTGTQYIDTNFIPSQDTEMELDFMDNDTTNDTVLCGCRNSSNTDTRFTFGTYNDKFIFAYGYGVNASDRPSITSGTRHTAIMSYGNATLDGVSCLVNTASIIFTQNIYIGCSNVGGSASWFAKTKYYAFRLRENGVLVRDLVPCYRKSDGEVGMYDLVSGTFLTNQGSGEFLAGVSILNNAQQKLYQQVEYIRKTFDGGTNNAYMDTGVNASYDLITEFVGKATDVQQASGSVHFFGSRVAFTNQAYHTYPRVDTSVQSYPYYDSRFGNFAYNYGSYVFRYTNGALTTIKFGNGAIYKDGSLALSMSGSSQFTSALNVWIFACNNNGAIGFSDGYGILDLYAMRQRRGANPFIRDFVPVYRKSDNEIGMLDVVNNTFYTNEGAGSFTKGNDV